ncbi:MAG: tetratricopeptide repeat protein [Bacteroidales bacterium]|nr:tetratricopeptide repeat protein [Bacteroidales bacterium]
MKTSFTDLCKHCHLTLIGFRIVLVSMFILVSQDNYSQDLKKLDSLRLIYKTSLNDSIRQEKAEKIFNELLNGNHRYAFEFAKSNVEHFEESKDEVIRGRAFDLMGEAHSLINNYDSALFFNHKALTIFEREQSKLDYGKSLMKKAYVLLHMSDLEESSHLAFEALKIFENLDAQKEIAGVYQILANINMNIGNAPQVINYLNRALEIYNQLQLEEWSIGVYYMLGNSYHGQQDYENAEIFFSKSLQLCEKYHNNSMKGAVLFSISYLKSDLGEIELARKYIFEALKIDRELGNLSDLSFDYMQLANYYLSSDSLQQAKSNLEMALQLAKETNNVDVVSQTLPLLAETFYQLKDYKAAIESMRQSGQLFDSLYGNIASGKINELEHKYRSEKKEQEYFIERQRDMFIRIIVISISVLLIIIALLIVMNIRIKSRRIETEKHRLEEELEHRNKELTTNVMYLVKKNELIANISKQLVKVRFKAVHEDNKRILSELVNEIQLNLDDELWKEFEVRFQEVHKSFYDNINKVFPDLTVNERRLAAFLRLNMTTKEIAAITQQNHSAIEVARSRLRKKLKIDNTDTSLSGFLSQF